MPSSSLSSIFSLHFKIHLISSGISLFIRQYINQHAIFSSFSVKFMSASFLLQNNYFSTLNVELLHKTKSRGFPLTVFDT